MAANPAFDPVLTNIYANAFNIPVELAQLVANRFPEYEEAQKFLNPRLGDLCDPVLLPDIDIVAGQLIEKLRNHESILIYGHDDPDGFTSTALLYKALREIARGDGSNIYPYIFNRETDGYIINPDVLEKYRKAGCRTIITVDFGISSEENFRIAASNHYELMVCDHHETRLAQIPVPAIDPKRPGSRYPFRDLAGVGVTLKLAIVLYQKALAINSEEFFSLKKEFTALAMIGTIADRVVLLDENRILCHAGIRAASQVNRGWLHEFQKAGNIDFGRVISEIIPTIASAAYVNPQMAIEMLISDDLERINALISKLKEITKDRRGKSDELFMEVIATTKLYPNLAFCIVPHVRQHYLSSIAARIRDHYNRAALIISIKDEKCHGELRSTGTHLHNVLSQHADLFIDFGGHRKAAGFTAECRNLDVIVDLLTRTIDDQSAVDGKRVKLEPELRISKDRVSVLKPMLPFGDGNKPPLLTDGISRYTIDNWLNISDKGL